MSDLLVIKDAILALGELEFNERIEAINELKRALHSISPFKEEPVDCVVWISTDNIQANDYNPNVVAPPEMELLHQSIASDGYTQPIVSWQREDGVYEVVDGFHRNRVGREYPEIAERIKGYLPLSVINAESTERGSRIAATIRHNRARGKHVITGMSDIVLELKNRNWTDERIAKELGMEQDEILRLCQITGLTTLFADKNFSKSWDIEDAETDTPAEEFVPISDDVEEIAQEKDKHGFRSANTNDPQRIFHTWDKWECYKAGFFDTKMDGIKQDVAEQMYASFLKNDVEFAEALEGVTTEWKHSCEHYLTNVSLNRIAWLGQAAACYARGLPAMYRGGFNLLTQEQQDKANKIALEYLNRWLEQHDREAVSIDIGLSGKQVDLY